MRKLITGVLAAALALGLALAQPAEAKVYKMKPEEREAALKEKKERKARAKKSKKAAEQAPGGWVEVKPGSKKAAAAKPEKAEKKSRKKVDEVAKAAEEKGKKSKHSKKGKAERVAEEKAAKVTKNSKKKSRDRNVPAREAFRGDRTGAHVSGSSTEVARPAGPNLDSYSVSRPGYEKGAAPATGVQAPAAAPVVPEVRHEVQPGPVDSSKPLGTELPKGGEGRF